MNYNTQNAKIASITKKLWLLVLVGIDVGNETHYARAYEWRNYEYSKNPLEFSNTKAGFLILKEGGLRPWYQPQCIALWVRKQRGSNKKIIVLPKPKGKFAEKDAVGSCGSLQDYKGILRNSDKRRRLWCGETDGRHQKTADAGRITTRNKTGNVPATVELSF